MDQFVTYLLLCLAAFAAVYLAQYVFFSTPTSYWIGFPYWFWTRQADYTRFRTFECALDLCIVAFCSYRFAGWYWLRRWRRLNRPDS